ncbi:ParB/RepB/Spo0J family partition protein [Deinococcus ficus]|uniref:ParB/RepB/Spo0J family partition protein n=1 Tax=Deinococcus ficus TaxID=317577 RepID=UPI0003B3214A|nr:ParB/RepB/Spo0J family partition protein [Deinococcus ficus]
MSKGTKRSRADAFGSLLATVAPPETDVSGLPLDRITVRPRQPRRHFDDASLASLAESVRERGILQPVLVRRLGSGYELIAGERRLRAARLAGLTEIPATVREATDEEADVLAALENLQREDLNPLDEVEATLTIVSRDLGVPVGEVVPLLHAQRRTPDPAIVETLERTFTQLGRGSWRSFAANKAGVLRFPEELLDAMRQGKLEYTRASALARIKDPAVRQDLLRRALDEQLGVREITQAGRAPTPEASPAARVRTLLDDRRLAKLKPEDRSKAEGLLRELEALLGGKKPHSAKRS